MKAGIYGRQSIDAAEGIARQVDRCRSLIAARGWESGPEYLDNDVSASKARGEGTEWARMLDDARTGVIDIIVAVNLDRLLRTQRDLLTLIESGVLVVTLEGELDLSTASGEMQASVLTSLARFEARRKGERQVRANEHKARNGKVVRGRRAFGYEADGVAIREAEADAVRWGFQALLDGSSLADIAREWNGRGLVPEQKRYAGARDENGKPIEASSWRHDNVRAVLLNPRYRGAVRRHGEIVHENAEWEALVDADTFQRVEAVLRDPARRRGAPQTKRLLSNIARCGVCHGPLHAGGSARPGVPAYRCKNTGGHIARMAEPVDNYVEAVICEFLANTTIADLATRDASGDDLAAEAEKIRTRIERLRAAFVSDDDADADEYAATVKGLRERLAGIEKKMLDALRAAELNDLVGRPDVRPLWDALTLERKRRILTVLPLDIVVYGPGRGTRTFRPETVQIRPKSIAKQIKVSA